MGEVSIKQPKFVISVSFCPQVCSILCFQGDDGEEGDDGDEGGEYSGG